MAYKVRYASDIWWCSRAAGGPNFYIGGIGGCCSASFDRLTMGSQSHPLKQQWGAFLAYKVRCASDIWWCSWAAGCQNHDIGGIGRCCSASFEHGITTPSISIPVGSFSVIQSPLCERYLGVLQRCGRCFGEAPMLDRVAKYHHNYCSMDTSTTNAPIENQTTGDGFLWCNVP